LHNGKCIVLTDAEGGTKAEGLPLTEVYGSRGLAGYLHNDLGSRGPSPKNRPLFTLCNLLQARPRPHPLFLGSLYPPCFVLAILASFHAPIHPPLPQDKRENSPLVTPTTVVPV